MKPHEYFKKLAASLPKLAADIAADVVAVEAEKFHAENFQKEGFTDASFSAWTPRKKEETPKRALLVKSSTLEGHALNGMVTGNVVTFRFPMAYMKVHNEGLKAGRGAGFTMPKRQFVGESKVLEERIEKKATQLLDKQLELL